MRFVSAWITGWVRSSELIADDVRLIELDPEPGARAYSPGSHIQVQVMVSGEPEARHYSLVGESGGDVYRIAVRLRPDGLGGSAYMHGLRAGARVQLTHPANHFELSYDASQYLLVAGGIGITPIISMASALRRRGADYRLAYAGRSAGLMPFLPDLAAEHGERLLAYLGSEGRRCDLSALFSGLKPAAEVYLCGPIGLRESAERLWHAAGRPPACLRFETFASSGAFPAEEFTVHMADVGMTVRVGEHVSMLDAMRAAGVDMMWDCLRGECGLCAVDVLKSEGILDHRDVFLSESQREAGQKICTCVSRAVGGSITVDSGHRGDGALTRRLATGGKHMANLVGAIGTSHSPMLLTDPRLWRERAMQDLTNPELFDNEGRHVSYAELAAATAGRYHGQLDEELCEQRYRLCESSMDRLSREIAELAPDTLVVIGDDQEEVFDSSNQPSMAVFWGPSWETEIMRGVPDNEFFELVKVGYAMDARHEFKGAPDLGLAVIRGLVQAGFDVTSVAATPPGKGFGHAYGFIIERLLGERVIPVLPVLLNTYFPPNQPTPARCYDFGAALGQAITAAPGDERVVLVASGGLSHFVIDEALDLAVLAAISNKDAGYLRSIPEHLLNAGSSEIRNWIAAAGAMGQRDVLWSEYVPCYRTEAGTGCAMAFLRWA